MNSHHTHAWSHITDLPETWEEWASPELANYVTQWKTEAAKLEDTDAYREFLIRLRRQWAIETGVLERLYTITEGASRTLIEKGLDAALLAREDTDQAPELVVSMIHDQAQALEALYQVISGERQLTTGYIKQLHQVITAHQKHCDVVDSLGMHTQVPLRRGEWKILPNHIDFGDGSFFQFCPPEQVASEMDQLIAWHESHQHQGVPPEIRAAWLHHRFTLIHPFQDGNGRIARCLATLVMLDAKWLPPVVTRNDRNDYLLALRTADDGDLARLVDFFGSLEQRAIREAVSLSGEVIRETQQIKEIVASAGRRLAARRQGDDERRQKLVHIAEVLHDAAAAYLREIAESVTGQVEKIDPSYKAYAASAARGDSERATYYYGQIINCANALTYRVNFDVYQAWTALIIDMTPYPKTEILFSFHGIGEGDRGIMGCAGMAYQKHAEYTEDQTKAMRFGDVTPLSSKPFEFTQLDDPTVVERNFRKWLERCTREGLRHWSEGL